MTPTFSILHATRGRPKKAGVAMRMWQDRATNPGDVQYILCCDEDDETRFDAIRETRGMDRFAHNCYVDHPSTGSAAAWDFAAKFSIGEILIQAQDDIEPPQNWDNLILNKFEQVSALAVIQFSDGSKKAYSLKPAFLAISDGYRKDRLCCTAIMNRARFEQQSEFLHAGYLSVFSDDEVTYRAYRDQRDEKCIVIEARDLVFLHRHHYHDKSVPMDATYERENSHEAYRIGGALFAKRNPEAFKDGLKNW